MPLQTADRLALAHQRELARIAADTQAAAAATARTATPADISGWWAGAADGLLARVSGGYAQARRSSVEFLRRHAAANGVTLDPVPASMDMTQARTSLRVTGPVAFKTSIAAGADVPHAMRSMSTQLQGSTQRLTMAGDRDTFEQTLLSGQGIIGWRRRLSGLKTCGFCAMLASRGAVYATRDSATVAKDGLRFHDHCVPAGTLVSGPTTEKAFRRWYEGEMVIVGMADVDDLAITPNHPVLTGRGWVPAGLLRVGDDVVKRSGLDWESLNVPHEYDVPSPIEDVWRAYSVDGFSAVPVAAEDFHGDGAGTQGNVYVIGADSHLADVFDVALCEPHAELVGAVAGAAAVAGSLLSFGDAGAVLLCSFGASDRIMGGDGEGGPSFDTQFGHAQQRGFVSSSAFHSGISEPTRYDGARYAEALADAEFGFSGLVGGDGGGIYRKSIPAGRVGFGPRYDPASAQGEPDYLLAVADRARRLRERLARGVQLGRVIELRRVNFSGHVYNLQTVEGWYAANEVIVSNCHCWAEPLYRHEPDPPEVQELKRQWQHVTAGERGEDKARAWRDHWENHVSPESRGRLGIAGTQTARVEQVFGEVRGRLAELGIPPVRRAIASGLPGFAPQAQPVRAALLRPKTARGVEQVWRSEMRRITGRHIPVDIPSGTSVLTSREYAEGVLRGLEAFPDAQLREIVFDVIDTPAGEYAHVTGGVIHFNGRFANEANRRLLLESLSGDVAKWEDGIGWSTRGDGTTVSTAIHEFGHVLDDTVFGRVHSEALLRMDTLARQAGLDTGPWLEREISAYSASDAYEMVAEAFADVLLRGDAASIASKRIFEVLEREYLAGGYKAGPGVVARAVAAPQPFKGMSVAELRDLARRNGVTIPPLSARADIVRLLERANVEPVAVEADLINLPSLGRGTLASRRARAELLAQIEAEPGIAIGLSEDLDALISQGLVRSEAGRFTAQTVAGRAQQTATRYFLTDQAKAEIVALRSGAGAAEVPLARQTAAQLRALAKERGVTIPAGAKKADIVRLLEAPPKTAAQKAAEVARAAQAVKDDARTAAEALADVLSLVRGEASARALAHRAGTLLKPTGPLTEAARKAVGPLAKALQSGDAAAIQRTAKALERKFKLTRVDAGKTPQLLEGREVVSLDRSLHEVIGGQGVGAGERVWLVRPGYTATIDGRKVTLVKAQVQAIPADVIQAAERKALREAARVKAAQIESATGTARLLAEIDQLIAQKAEASVIRQRLSAKLIEREQLFAGASDEVRAALLAVADDPVKLRAAVTRAGTKAKIKPISKAGTKTKFDADTMESVGGEIKAGTPVTVVTRGSSVTLPDGTVVQIAKARVTPVAKVDPTVAKAQAHVRAVAPRELDATHRAQVLAGMDRQAAAAPQSTLRLKGITPTERGVGSSYGKYQPAQGFGSPLSRHLDPLTIHLNPAWSDAASQKYRDMLARYAADAGRGYFTRVAATLDPIEYTVSHEFGHHIMRMMSFVARDPSGVHEYLGVANARVLLTALDEHLGTTYMTQFDRHVFSIGGGRKVADPDWLDHMMGTHSKRLATEISGYAGSGRFHETMAEIWALYSTLGEAAPAEIRAVGEVMRRLAEKQAAKGVLP